MANWALRKHTTGVAKAPKPKHLVEKNKNMSSNKDQSVADSSGEILRIRSRIEKLVSDRFEGSEDIYYLSKLGTDLGDDRKLIERLSGMKFANFMQKNFDFEIGQTGIHQNVLYIRRPGGGRVNLPIGTPRYKRRFWAAFAIPLDQDGQQFINLDTLEFGSSRDEIGIGGAEVRSIDRKYITADGEYGTPTEIVGRIKEWLSDQNLEQTPFLIQERRTRSGAGEFLLDALLNTLSDDQLKRVNLPLDVVKALSDQRNS